MVSWTEQEYLEFLARNVPRNSVNKADLTALPPNPIRGLASGRLPNEAMNKTEAAYDAHLWLLRHSGDILWHKFGAIKLRLAGSTFYTCDFAVLPTGGGNNILEMHEVKGFWRDDARVKIKVAASIYPFKFIAVSPIKGGGWKTENFW